AFDSCQPPYFFFAPRAAPRLWLHPQGLSARGHRGRAPLWRDAPLYPDLRLLGGGTRDGASRQPSSTPAWELKIRAWQNCSSDPRPRHALFHRSRVRPADAILGEIGLGILGPCRVGPRRRIGIEIQRRRIVDPNTTTAGCRDDRAFGNSIY